MGWNEGIGPANIARLGIRRMMVFVDGENLVLRYQAMLAKGHTPGPDVKHEKDVYVWSPRSIDPEDHIILRATYYTYTCGDQQRTEIIAKEIKNLSFQQFHKSRHPNTLYPCVFWKSKKSAAAKGVDINMTVDILKHVYYDNLDTVFLVTGDGDYFPIIDESIRRGKTVYVASLSSGLNPKLPILADRFFDLDKIYFGAPAD